MNDAGREADERRTDGTGEAGEGAPPQPAPMPDGGVPAELRSVARDLAEHGRAYDFFRAVLLLERLRPDRERLGGYASPDEEAVRIGVNPSLAFAPNQIHDLEIGHAGDDGAARMTVNFLGLVGPQGVMPTWYTQLVGEREWEGDTALRDFLDLFHHRMLSLFYRAWRKNRFLVSYEEAGDDPLSQHLLDLIGSGPPELRARTSVDEHSLAFYAGLLSPQQRSARALEQLVADYFDVPAEVEQFVGGWYPVDRSHRCRLGAEDTASQLGVGAVVGDEIWDQQARVRIWIGPLSRERFEDFLPEGSAHEELRSVVRFFGRGEYDFEARLIMAADEVPGVVLDSDDEKSQALGWSTWIRTRPRRSHADETILAL